MIVLSDAFCAVCFLVGFGKFRSCVISNWSPIRLVVIVSVFLSLQHMLPAIVFNTFIDWGLLLTLVVCEVSKG